MGIVSDPYDHETIDNEFGKNRKQLMTGYMNHVLDAFMPGWSRDPSMEDTTKRFVKYLLEFRQPLDYEKIFGTTFALTNKDDASPVEGENEVPKDEGIVVQTNIPFRAVCEHHLLPMHGRASVGYIPNNKLLGLSKFVRLVEGVGLERPSLQEHIGNRIADLMVEHLEPKGVAVVISSEHTCMSCRGVHAPDVVTVSSALRGVFMSNPLARAELMELIKHR